MVTRSLEVLMGVGIMALVVGVVGFFAFPRVGGGGYDLG